MYFHYQFKPTIVKRIRYITHKHKSSGYSLKTQTHRWQEIIYLDYGKMHLVLPEQHIVIQPGECVFIPSLQPHKFYGESDLPFDFLNIGFTGFVPENLQSRVLGTGREQLEILEKIKREINIETPCNSELIACMLTEFIYWMTYRQEIPQMRHSPEPANHKLYRSSAVRRALTIIAKEYHTEVSLQKISTIVGLSESRLRLLIRNETGQNFSYHLQSMRIEAAKHMLRHSSVNIGEIAAAVGYSSQPFFFKVFRRFTGMTPLGYASTLGDAEEQQ